MRTKPPTFSIEPLEPRCFMSASFANAQDPQLVVDPAGTLHLAYYDTAEHNLKYASKSSGGEWSDASIVDAAGDVGQRPALAIDRGGMPGIAYRDASNADLKYAHLTAGGWSIVTVDAKGDVGVAPTLAYDQSNRPLMSYFAPTGAAIKIVSFDGLRWKPKSLGKVGTLARAGSSIAISPAGTWSVTFQQSKGALVYTAQTKKVGAAQPRGGIVGASVMSLVGALQTRALRAIDPIGKYRRVTVVAKLAGAAQPSLAFDGSSPVLSYYDVAAANLALARLNGSRWITTAVAPVTPGTSGTHLFIDPANGLADIAYSDAAGALRARSSGGSFAVTRLYSGRAVVAHQPGSNVLFLGTIDNEGALSFEPSLAPVTALAVTVASAHRIDVSWSNSPATGTLLVERAAGSGSFSTVATLAGGATAYVDTTVSDFSTYNYRVRIVDAIGREAVSDAISAATPLAAPTDLSAVSPSINEISLSWTDASAAESGYVVQRSLDGQNFDTIAALPDGSTDYTDDTLSSGASRSYRVIATTTSGAAAFSSAITALSLPDVPDDLVAGPGADPSSTIDLTWSAPSGAVDGYKIARSSDGVNFTDIASIGPQADSNGNLTFTDTNLPGGAGFAEGSVCTYQVRAFNSAGEGDAIEAASDVPTWLRAPTNLTATATSPGHITLNWTNPSAGATGFMIGYSTNGLGWTILANPSGTSTQYVVTTGPAGSLIVPGTGCYFWVIATSADNSSDYSNTAIVTAS